MKTSVSFVVAVLLMATSKSNGATLNSVSTRVEHTTNTANTRTTAPEGLRPLRNYFFDLKAGVNSVGVQVDTVSDLGRITSLDLKTPALEPVTFTDSFDVNFNVVVRPPNFPDPGEVRNVQGTYSDKIVIQSLSTSGPPKLVSAVPALIDTGPAGSAYFALRNRLNLMIPNITISGVYEITTPMRVVTTPFSVSLAGQLSGDAVITIPTNQNFTDGFIFNPEELNIRYGGFTGGFTLYDGIVDDVRFRALLFGTNVDYFVVPEPSACIAAAIGAFVIPIARRLRRLRGRRGTWSASPPGSAYALYEWPTTPRRTS